jgi:hypothetical protein
MEMTEKEKPRLVLEPEVSLDDDPAPPGKIRYIFTVVMPVQVVPDNPLMTSRYLNEMLAELNERFKPERIGVVAVTGG